MITNTALIPYFLSQLNFLDKILTNSDTIYILYDNLLGFISFYLRSLVDSPIACECTVMC